MIYNVVQNYTSLLVAINVVEGIAGLLMFLIPDRKGWQGFLVCLYGGFLFGMIPFYYIFENEIMLLVGCIILSIIFVCMHHRMMKTINLPLGIVLFKLILLLGITLLDEQYEMNRFGFYIMSMFLSLVAFCVINGLFDLSDEKLSYLVSGLFGVLELSGAIIQFYRIDYTYFHKELFSKSESVSFFLYLLKVDYWIFDYQYLYLFVSVMLLFIFIIWRKLIQKIQVRYNYIYKK